MNPTLIGLFSVLVWGIALPFIRIFEGQIGPVAYIGAMYTGIGAMGLIHQFVRRKPFPREVFRNPALYGRWLFFVIHVTLLMFAISIVQKPHVPFLILVNYLWPTGIILFSVLLAGVKITRWWSFILGTLVVIASMANEIVGPAGLSLELFARPADCIAYAMTFTGAMSWGLYSALSRRAGAAGGGGTVIPLFQITMVALVPVSLMPGMATWGHLSTFGPLVLAGYCFIQFLAYQSWDHGMRLGNVVILSLFADFIPWLSLLSAHLLLGVDIGNRTIVSAISLVMGAMITRYGTLQKKVIETLDLAEP